MSLPLSQPRQGVEFSTAFTYSFNEKDRIISYIKNQQEHHRNENTEEEMKRL